MKKFICFALASATLASSAFVSAGETNQKGLVISYNGISVVIPERDVHLYFDAGNDIYNGSQGWGDNRDWLIMNGADQETAVRFVNILSDVAK